MYIVYISSTLYNGENTSKNDITIPIIYIYIYIYI